ncbi:MAG: hypothetical protein NTV94_07710 [Planctomycetota bacterium]|nr:hypothetical protein [Planctomycetota bacterium]
MTAAEQTTSDSIHASAIRQRELLGVVAMLGSACDKAMEEGDTQRLVQLLDERRVVLTRIAEVALQLSSAPRPVDTATQRELDGIDAMIDQIGREDLERFDRMSKYRDDYALQLRGASHAGRAAAAYGRGQGAAVTARAEDCRA